MSMHREPISLDPQDSAALALLAVGSIVVLGRLHELVLPFLSLLTELPAHVANLATPRF